MVSKRIFKVLAVCFFAAIFIFLLLNISSNSGLGINYKDAVSHPEKFEIKNTEFGQSIYISLDMPEDEKIENVELYNDGTAKIILQKIVSNKGDYEIFIDYMGCFCDDRYVLVSPEKYDSDSGRLVLDATAVMTYDLDGDRIERDAQWRSYQVNSDGISMSYCVFNSDLEKEKAAQSDSVQVKLLIKDLTLQEWSKL